jgi:hypothetical protein
MAEPQLAADTPLSVDQASGLLSSLTTEVEPDEVIAADTESEAEPTADDALEPEEAIEDETEETSEPDEPAIAAPHSWDAQGRAVFQTLPREAQQAIVERESARDAVVTKATQEAAETRKRAEAEVQGVTQLRSATEQVLTRAAQVFRGKWDNVDWVAWAQADPAAYTAGKAQFEAEQGELQRLAAVQQAQTQTEMKAFQARKASEIKTLAPDLVDPAKGPQRLQALESFLANDLGIDRAVFPTLDAQVIALAYDGYRYRQLQKTAGAKPAPRSTAPVRPSAASPARTPQRAAAEAVNRFRQTGSVDDAVAALTARS